MAEFRHIVTSEDTGKEVREILRTYFAFSARLRNRIKREKLVLKNGVVTEGWYKVEAGDVIQIVFPEETSHFQPENIPLDIVYEDEDIMLINKQPGLIVHPTKGHPKTTVANALMHYQADHNQSWKIRFVNRLDMDTSGLLIVAKNAYCQNEFTNQMKKNIVQKRYLAIVSGMLEEDGGIIDAPIGRPDPIDVRRGVTEDGAPSITHYRVLDRFPAKKTIDTNSANEKGISEAPADFTFVELLLETGRTHQIRVHMAHMGHPILGDHLYSTGNPYRGKAGIEPDLPGETGCPLIDRQALHAASLTFIHPVSGEKMEIIAAMPEDIKKVIEKLR